ncbi:MAG: hypothetical protein U0704_04735 [Candidatus Eisenbacteria bacterium]
MKSLARTLLLASLTAFPAAAAETTPAPAPATAPVVETPAPVAAEAAPAAPAPGATSRFANRRMSPLAIAMAAVVESEQVRMTALKKRMAAAKDPVEVDAIQREVEQLKFESEIQLLSLQAKSHRQAGRVEAANRLDESILSLRRLREASTASRPAPSTTR